MDPILEAVLNGTHRTDLTAEQEQQLADYLESPEGQQALSGLEDDLGQAAGYLEPPELPEAQWERVHQAVRALGAPGAAAAPPSNVVPMPQPVQPAQPSQLPKLVAIAAAVLLVLGVGLFLPLDVLMGDGQPKTVGTMDTTPDDPPSGPAVVLEIEEGPGYSVKPYTVDNLLVFRIASKD